MLEMLGVACRKREAVFQGGGCDQTVDGWRVFSSQSRNSRHVAPSQRCFRADWKNPARKTLDQVMIEPLTQGLSLSALVHHDDSAPDFAKRDDADVSMVFIKAMKPIQDSQ